MNQSAARHLLETPATIGEARPSSVFTLVRPADESRVLIVDDDDVARARCAAALRAAGCVVEEAANGVDALRLFQTSRPHIALLEVMMPFLDGFSTCRAIRDLPGGKDATIVMMTDLDDIESLQFGYDAGATDFITKPINATLLQHRLKYMLRAASAADQLRRSERKIAHLAYHDALTGLPNRRSLERYMDLCVTSRPEESGTGAIFLIDLDGFKRVNDTFGHTAGDELICQVGRRVVERFAIDLEAADVALDITRPILARLGGDEFVFVEPSVRGPAAAAAIANELLDAIGRVYDLRGHEIVMTASIGMSFFADSPGDVEALVQRADAAMYDAKAHDRNNARFYSRALSDKAHSQLEMEGALRHALALGEMAVFYQPKIDVCTNTVTGAEALLRWHHPVLGMISPETFIPIAEETGLIIPIGRWVLLEACREACRWHEVPEMAHLRIAVNVSARQFRDPGFLPDLRNILATTGLNPHALELEITEGTLMNDTKLARALLRELKELGVWLALDDFGTGYSSLGYLRRFPFDTLKVDRSFVRDVLTDEGSAAITSAVIAMARALHLAVVAEGVETAEQLDFLRGLGCEQVQGFLFNKAVPADEFVRWAGNRLGVAALSAPREMAPEGRRSAIPPLR